MATKWEIRGREYVNCNCAYGCPCQFNALPTYGNCKAVMFFHVDEGRHRDTILDGLGFALIVSWPGPIHEGHGQVVHIVEERASPRQREAILRIMRGDDTEPGATVFQVFSTTMDKVHAPIFARIDFKADAASRQARVSISDVVDARGEPIVNSITGNTHRARINLPNGFEYDVCEVARGWAEAKGPVKLSLADSHAYFATYHMTESGVANHA